MKKLYIFSGPQASGKSTFIKENNLEEYTISLDKLRDLYSSPEQVLRGDKVMTLRNSNVGSQAFKLAYDLLEFRLMNGQTTIIDATNVNLKTVTDFKKIADKYLTKTSLVKFGRDLSISELIKRDSKREVGFVGELGIRKFYNRMIEFDKSLSKRFNTLTPEEFLNDLNWRVEDITNKYTDIMAIGDVHSCGTALQELVSDFKEDRLYILLGDNFDRGIEHSKTMTIISELLTKNNVIFLLGNHEKHIFNFATGQSLTGRDFKFGTLPDIMRSGFEISHFRKIINKSQPAYICEFNGCKLYFSHSGFVSEQLINTDISKRMALNEDRLYTDGLGGYSIDLDEDFDKAFKNTNIYQFHGHRNTFLTNVITGPNQHSFNLEQKVEHGNRLGAVLIKKNKKNIVFKDCSIDNDIYDSEKLTRYDEFSESYDFKVMMDNKYVKVNELENGIKCLNFTSDAFFNKVWNFETINARGLFIDSANHIVARGYEKFFNLGEVKTTELDYIASKFKQDRFVTKIDKANGFLGIVSYIPELGGLQVFSKGAGEDFSKLAKEVLVGHLEKNGFTFDEYESFIKSEYDSGERFTQTFEIIDPINDPHIVEYSSPKVVLLDVIYNTMVETINNDKADFIAEKFKFERPFSEDIDVSNMSLDEIKNWLLSLLDDLDTEGYVIVSNSARVKIKTNWYSSRKRVRNTLERALGFKSDKAKVNILRKFAEKHIDSDYITEDTINDILHFADDIEENSVSNIVFTNGRFNLPETYKKL